MSPVFALVSAARGARTFHPRGVTFQALLQRHPEAPHELGALVTRLTGPALVRFSGALWKQAQRLPDVLGCAIRFRNDDRDSIEPEEGDQDLLLATIRRPWTMGFSPLTTDVRDYLANDYFSVSPFDVGLARAVYFRLTPIQGSSAKTGTRGERLLQDIEFGRANLTLELSAGPFGPWTPLVVMTLERAAHVDEEALRFSPFRAGRGLSPRGFIHALRVGAYALSQRARPRTAVG